MLTALIAVAVGLTCLTLGVLLGLITAYLFAESLVHFLDLRENPGIEPGFDPDEERLDLLAIRDLLTAAEAVGGCNGGEDTTLRKRLGAMRTATAVARDRFEDLIDDLDDEAESDERTCAPTTTAGV